MSAEQTGNDEARPLEILGISEPEERAYRWLLNHPRATTSDAAQALTLPPSKAQRLFDTIEAKGLMTHTPERPRRYIPASPDIALNALMFRRQESLQRAAGAIQELQEQAATRKQGEQEPMVELVVSREAQRQVIEQMDRTAQHEVVVLIRPPIIISRLNVPSEKDNPTLREALDRGICFRSIVDRGFLALAGAVNHVRADMKAGEEVRAISNLPFKMILADRRLALVPLDLDQPEGPSLLVRSSALLDALHALFELLWKRAAPISFTRARMLETNKPNTRLSAGTEDLLSLMAAGLNDKKIAYELHISQRTLERRVAELMRGLGTRTRFQTGWLAALHLSGATLPPDT